MWVYFFSLLLTPLAAKDSNSFENKINAIALGYVCGDDLLVSVDSDASHSGDNLGCK